MKDAEQAKMLLLMAGKDHRALLVMQDTDAVAVEIFGLHVQQAVEKSIKAWLCLLGAPYPKKHDLDELAALLAQAGESVPDEFASLLAYTDFAVAFRYEAFSDFDADIDRQAITTLVGRLLQYVDRLLLSLT